MNFKESTATDDRIEENRNPAPIAPATRDERRTEPSGLPPGRNDDRRSPLDLPEDVGSTPRSPA